MVSNKCCVNGCHKSSKTKFGVPIKDIAVWEKSLDTQLTSVSRICLKRPRLKTGVVPTNIIYTDHEKVVDTTSNSVGTQNHNYSLLTKKKSIPEEFEYPDAKRTCISMVTEGIARVYEVIVKDKSLFDQKDADEFFTQQTAGSRVKIQSYIDITLYLLDKCNFSYVSTSKMNQDNLEKFFDVIRQIAGPNDHPSTPTFLQLYRMLNIYSLLKPPKSGNCKADEDIIFLMNLLMLT
ncbi:hypothetical protein QTP88_014829 [Uroleucon formosanum]